MLQRLASIKGRSIFKTAVLSVIFALSAVLCLTFFQTAALAIETGLDYGTFTGLGTQDVRISIMQIVRIVLGLVGIIAIIIIIYAGFLWMTSAGNADQIDRAKRTLRNAAIGLLIIFLAFAIVSFIIQMLEGTLGLPTPPQGSPPGTGCDNCGFLGGGIIESVYPVPNQLDVPRNTNIIVTFKVAMDPTTVVANDPACQNPPLGSPFAGCDGELEEGAVLIFVNSEGESAALAGDSVRVRTTDRKTFVFDPVGLLGNTDSDIRYAVKLTNDIRRSDGAAAFQGLGSFFQWRFWVGTLLDIDPPEVSSVFPPPDHVGDSYDLEQAQAASGTLGLVAQPRTEQTAAINIQRSSPPAQVCAPGQTQTACSPSDPNACGGDPSQCIDNPQPNLPQLLVSQGPYNGQYEGTLTLTLNSIFDASASWNPPRAGNSCSFPASSVGNSCDTDADCDSGSGADNGVCVLDAPNSFAVGSGTINLGDGVILSVTNPTPGSQWQVELVPNRTAQTIRIGDLSSSNTFTFVNDSPNANQIAVGLTIAETAGNIAQKIQASNVPVTAAASSSTVAFTARTAGAASNQIFILAATDWANVTPMSGGRDLAFLPTQLGAPDQPRNALIRLDFNEVMNPVEFPTTTGVDEERVVVEYLSRVCTAATARAGELCGSDSDCDTSPGDGDGVCGLGDADNPADWQRVESGVQVSNLYQSIELIPRGECLDEQGNSLVNSCGHDLFCWPFIDPNPYEATRYRVVIKPALLADCQGSPSGDGTGIVCGDVNYGECVNSPGGQGQYCRGVDGIYPEAETVSSGAMDAASNSMNGNRNTYTLGGEIFGLAEGPQAQSGQPAFELNKVCQGTATRCLNSNDCGADVACVFQPDTQGDDLIWEFYINRTVELNPPALNLTGPNVAGVATSLTLPIEHTFDKVMRTGTVKPGSNYRDGSCLCQDPAGNGRGSCDAGQICKIREGFARGSCVLENEDAFVCLEDSECEPVPGVGAQCRNQKYLTLVDESTQLVGWWVTSASIDTDFPVDGYGDISRTGINHTPLSPVTRYGAEVGSGVQDIYQNCYLPSQGPDGDPGFARCSITQTISCVGDIDCPLGERCESPIVQGRCSQNGAQLCSLDSDCGSGNTCVAENLSCLTAADVAAGKVYCCNGRALTQAQWEVSGGLAQGGCFTGY